MLDPLSERVLALLGRVLRTARSADGTLSESVEGWLRREILPPLENIAAFSPAEDQERLGPLGEPLDEFLGRDFPEVPPVVEGIYPSLGNGVIGGEEKLAKTWYMLSEALALALGLPVFGRYAVPQSRRVLVIEEEDNARRTWVRVRALLRGYGLDPDDAGIRHVLHGQFVIAVFAGVRLDKPEAVQALVARLETFKPDIVYFDPFRKVTAKPLGKPEIMGPLLGQMDDLARRYVFAWRLVHHYRRAQGPRTGRGSSEIVGGYEMGAWVESSLYFEPVGRSHQARLTVQSKDAPSDLHLLLHLETEGPEHAPTLVRLTAEEDAGQSKAAETDEQVLTALQALEPEPARSGSPGVTVKAMAKHLGWSADTIRRSLARLGDGRVGCAGRGAKGLKLYAPSGQSAREVNPMQTSLA